MVHQERVEIEAEHRGAYQVEPHLRVDAAAEPLRVRGAPQVQVGEKALSRTRCAEHYPEREEETERAGAREALPSRDPQEVPRDEAPPAEEGPERDDRHVHGETVEAISIRPLRPGVDHVAVDPPRGDCDMEQRDGQIDDRRRKKPGDPHVRSLVLLAISAIAARRDRTWPRTKRASRLTRPGTTVAP